MTWTVGDHGFEMTLSAGRCRRLIARHLRPWLEALAAQQGVALDEVARGRSIRAGRASSRRSRKRWACPEASLATSRAVFAEYGNMSSPTVLFILDRLRRQGAPRPCVVLGFGPGLVAEVALIV